MIEFLLQIRFIILISVLLIAGIAASRIFFILKKRHPSKKVFSLEFYTTILLLIALVTSFIGIESFILNRTATPDELHTKSDLDAIIILGSGVENGKPGPLMLPRLQASLPLVQRFDRVPIVVTGAITNREPLAEAEVMKNYLVEQGIESNRILIENQALDTKDNVILSENILRSLENSDLQVLVITNDFHIARSEYLIQKHTNLDARFFSAPTPKDHYLNYMIREYFAFVQDFVFER